MADPRASFGPVAERYATSAVHGNPAALHRLIELARPSGGWLLDIASGSGHTAIAFSPFVDRVLATDLTLEMARVCRDQAALRGASNLEVALARAEALPFRAEAFDAVTCRIAPHHFDHPPMFIAEVRRVLKPGGWFLLVDNVGPTDRAAARELDAIERERDPSHRAYLSAETWRGLLQEQRFQIRHEETNRKKIGIDEWLERMAVPNHRRLDIRRRIAAVSGPLQDYLQPNEAEFTLDEQVFLADNPR